MAEPFPPPDYIPVSSAVDGIEVYAPAPPDAGPQQEVVSFSCPQCGATTAYSVKDGGLTCTHCGYYEPPQKEIVGKKAQEFEFTVETLERAAHGWGNPRKELECQNCGARTSIPVEVITHSCAFCGSNNVIQREAPQDLLRPRFLIPFKIESDACCTVARQWLGSSWMTPRALQKAASLAAFTGIYLPFWTFDSVTNAAWKAEVGHTETEKYYQDGEWKTRTKTVWRWESGQVRIKIDDLLVPGTIRLSNLLLGKLNDFNLGQLAPYEPEYLAGFHAQAYDTPLEKAWDTGRQEMRERTRQACIDQASTSKVRNFSMNLDYSDEKWRYILLPVYIATYTYSNQTYQVMVNGQTGTIAGQRPVDWTKVWLVVAAILAPGVILGLLGLLTVFAGGLGVVIGGVGFLLLIIGIVVAVLIVRKAMSLDDI
jgi:ribosomal protein L37E